MSYDLAVWEGKRPKTAAAAKKTFATMFAKYQDVDESPGPTPAIARYVEALLAKYPDLDDDNEDTCPWADGPLINNATGPIFYFAMVFEKAKTASAFAAKLAKERGLVCFDPQLGKLR